MISIVTWEEILLAEERGRKTGGSISNQTLKKSQPETQSDTESTILLDLNNKRIYKYEEVINKTGRGIVHSIGIKSASSAFGISIQIDDNNELRRSYSDLNDDTGELCGISAYINGGFYIISISDLKFRDKIKVGPFNTAGGSLTYEKIQGKFEVV